MTDGYEKGQRRAARGPPDPPAGVAKFLPACRTDGTIKRKTADGAPLIRNNQRALAYQVEWWGDGVLLLLPRAGGVKTSEYELRTGERSRKREQSEAQGAGGRAARRPRGAHLCAGGVGWGLTRTLSLPWGLGAGSRRGYIVLSIAGENPQKTNDLRWPMIIAGIALTSNQSGMGISSLAW